MRYLYILLIAVLLVGTQPAIMAQAVAPGAGALEAQTRLPSGFGSPTIDGERDAVWGEPVAVDPLGDMTQSNLDLHGLYLLDDADNYYIGFDAFASDWGMTYGIYIDTDQADGSGATSDPWGRAVAADSAHLPEYALYAWHDEGALGAAQLTTWNGSGWDYPTLASGGGAQAFSPANDWIEYRIPKSALGNPEHIALIVFTTGGSGHAQDTVPSDPAVTFTEPDWGGDVATLSNFFVFPPLVVPGLSLVVSSPTANQVFYGPNLNVTGTVDPAEDVDVTVDLNGANQYTPDVEPEGTFVQALTLTPGANTITVTADDGNETKQVVRNVTYVVSLDNDIQYSALGHNSRDPLYRNPGGAVTTGTEVTLRLRAANNDLELARVRIWNDRTDTQAIYNMTKVASNISFDNDAGPYEFWEVTLPASADPTVYWYRFIVKDGTKTAYYEDDNARTGGWGEAFDESQDNSYQLSIYAADFTTPDWVKNAVIYQIFPDRFRDGDSNNNPAAGEFFYGNNDTVYRSNGTDWNTPICDPRENFGGAMDCEDAWSQNFYGGDLRGIIEKLDYIDELGVTAIYLNPIFESPSNHKYDTADFGKIDPHFGTLGDFEELVEEANNRDIYIILDGVFNHVSSDSPYMDRYSRYDAVGACESETSPYRDWFYFEEVTPGTGPCVGDDGTPNAADYESWWGYDSLPKLRANSNEVRQLIWDSNAPGTTEGIAAYWIQQGASGWRLDVAGDVDPGTTSDPTNDYWEGFRDALHAINPDAYVVGEEWGNAISWTLGGEWDASMNYQMSSAILSFWRDTPYSDNDFNTGSSAGPLNPIKAGALNDRLLNLQERYPPEVFAAMMNLFGSHDTSRPLFLLDHNADENDVSLYLNQNYDWSDSATRLMGAALIQMTMPGAPTIYYGDEIGLVGPVSFDGSQWQDDPYNRQPYPWLDEDGIPYYAHLQTETGLRGDLLDYYKILTATRHSVEALRTGSFDPLWTDSNSDIYAYGRKMADDSSAAIIVVNKAATTGSVTLDVGGYLPVGATVSDALSPATFVVDGNGELEVTNVPARGGYLLVVDDDFSGDRPGAPVISASAVGGEQVSVSWSAVAGADVYAVYRSQLSGGGYKEIGATMGTSFDDNTVIPGTRYYYVVEAYSSSGLVSELSNEVSAIPAYVIDWANLQWPGEINPHVRSLVSPTENIYGRVYIDGVSGNQNDVDPTPGLIAQVGYGNSGSLPTHVSWVWFDTSFNLNAGDYGPTNDEFVGQMVVEAAPGNYDYLYRYSTDGGETWVYGAFDNIFYASLDAYDSDDAGKLTVVASDDTDAPDAPTGLVVTGTTTDSISLAWDAHDDDDGDLYGFEVWRKDLTDSEPGFTRVALLSGAGLTAYTDSTVAANHEYEYYITAIDVNVNSSDPSNTVTAVAEMRYVEVTFRVTVPDPTPGTVYIAGSLPDPYPFWNPGGAALTETATPGIWEVTLDILDGSTVEYKYARGDWERVEKGPAHEEIANRSVNVSYGIGGTQLVENTIANWRDPIVAAISPANGATGVAPNAVITVSWNQDMADPINPPACFSVTGPGGLVAGEVVVDGDEYTFTPDDLLEAGEHTVSITGCKDIHGDNQQVASLSSFTVNTRSVFDYDGDGKSDPAKFYPSSGVLWWLASSTSSWESAWLGDDTAELVTGSDYDGDGKADPAKFVSSESLWYLESMTGLWQGVYLGADGAVVGRSDFDGDDKTDPAKFVSSIGALWYIESSSGLWQGVYLGPDSFEYLAGNDFDGDGYTDPAKYVPSVGVLWYYRSTDSTWQGVYLGVGDYEYISRNDYDGDGKSDPTVFYANTGTVWWQNSSTGTWDGVWMGSGTFTFVGGHDFDGDGKTDLAKFDPVTGILSWLSSSDASWYMFNLGTDGYDLAN